jgi:hypothetical protein
MTRGSLITGGRCKADLRSELRHLALPGGVEVLLNGATNDHICIDDALAQRHLPPPWPVEELDACFVVRGRNGQQLAYVYFDDEPGRR